MKKFLTVLLALSVVFTYSFATVGTAFATTTSEADAAVTAAQKEAKDTADAALKTVAYADGYIAYINGEGANATGKKISATAVNQAVEDLQVEINKKIRDAADSAVLDSTKTLATEVAAVKTAYYNDNATYLKKLFDWDSSSYKYDRVLKKQAVIDKSAALAKLNAVDSSAYYNFGSPSDKSKVEDALKVAKNTITPLKGDAGDVAAIASALSTFDSAIESIKTIADSEKELAGAKETGLKALDAAAKTFKGDAATGETKRLNDIIKSASSTPAAVADAQAKLNALDSNIAAVSNMFKNQINAVKVSEDKNLVDAKSAVSSVGSKVTNAFANDSAFYTVVDSLGGVAFLKNYANTKAEAIKAELAADGTVKYYAATVDEALQAVNAQIDSLSVKNVSAVDSAFTTALTNKTRAELDAALDSARGVAVSEVTTGAYLSSNWSNDADRMAKVIAIQDEAKAAIANATSQTELTKIVADARAKMDAILNNAQINSLKEFVIAEYPDKYKSLIDGQVASLVSKNGADNYDLTTQQSGIETKVKDYFLNAVLAKEKVLTRVEVNAIMAENYAGALTVVEKNLTTKASLEAAEKTLNDQIAALPLVVTADNKAAVYSAYEAYLAYKDMPGYNDSKVSKAKLIALVTSALKVDADALKATQNALLAKATFTMDDVEAAVALKKAIDEYNVKYVNYDGFAAVLYDGSLDSKIAAAKYADAIAKINAIPEEITYKDADVVAEARKAYDNLNASQKAALNPSFLNKLTVAEKMIEQIDAAATKTKNGVKATKVTAKATAGKKYIKLTWKKSAGYKVDGYKVYRATKKNGTYKLVKTTKSTSFKNTKLKSGKTYYYKVRGYRTVNGVKVYTKYSAKVYKKVK